MRRAPSLWFQQNAAKTAQAFPPVPVLRVPDPPRDSVALSTPVAVDSLRATRDDFQWKLNVPGATEAFTFYLTLSNGTYVLAQMVHSTVGLSPSIQMTLRIYNSDKTKYANTVSPAISSFKISDDRLSTECEQMSFKFNQATNGYTLLFDMGSEAAIDVTLTPTDAGNMFKLNSGRTLFTERESDGFVDAQFMAKHVVHGSLTFSGKRTEVTGFGANNRVIQFKPQVPAKWNYLNLQTEKDALMLYEFDLPKGGKCMSIGSIVRDGRLIAVTTLNRAVHVQKQTDAAFSGYDVPTQLFVVMKGKTKDTNEDVHVELSITPTNLVDSIDVLAQLPYLLKVIIQTFITAPFVYQWVDTVKARVTVGAETFEIAGQAFIETNGTATTMRLTITDAQGTILHPIEVSPEVTIADLKALVEADMRIPANSMVLTHNGLELSDASKTIRDSKVVHDDVILVAVKPQTPSLSNGGISGTGAMQQFENLRLQLLSDPQARQTVAARTPELVAAINDPPRFHRILGAMEAQRRRAPQESFLGSADEFSVDAQKRIEEAIKKENIHRNLELAMEMHPESFGRVIMLYIDIMVNGVPVKAFVDSGAQATIMSPSCAERCKIMHLLDERFAGIAEGVGTAKILGRVHHAEIQIGKQSLDCSFTIMEGKGVELLFGLDQLRRYLACIDLAKNCLVINGEEIPFLAEHQLPEYAREKSRQPLAEPVASTSNAGNVSGISGAPASVPRSYPEDVVKGLMDLGVSREAAIRALNENDGNAEMAANSLF
ncbi:DNA damage-inducible protein 1 [Entophlyctis luteolus]|nr:DNA damage-inducible protein 1 [Entophlyctis luteolus]